MKLGFTGVEIIFLISVQNIDCEYLFEAVLTSTYVLSRNKEKYQDFLSENFHFLVVKFSGYLNRHVRNEGNEVGQLTSFSYVDSTSTCTHTFASN